MQKEMNFEKVAIASLSFDPSNVRKHDKKNIESIKASLRKFGQQKPIVVDRNNIVIAGNGTMEAAKAIGMTEIYISRSDLQNAEALAYAISDNRTAELAEWDKEPLGAHLQGLQEDGWDLEELGFKLDDIKDLDLFDQPDGGSAQGEDDIPEVAQNLHKVELGQIWQLGEHRLMCGDSTDKATVDKLMNGEKADMVFTDPPYGIGYSQEKYTGNLGTSENNKSIMNDDKMPDISNAFSFGCLVYIWGANNFTDMIPEKGVWHCWDKRSDDENSIGNADGLIGSQFELVWCNKKTGYQKMFRIMHCGAINKDGGKRVHPTQKPSGLAVACFEHENTKEGANVVDLFLGSGSTLIACEKTNRKCYGMELDPHYCSVIIQRYIDFTGKEAKLL
jgi:DNA modification methylase